MRANRFPPELVDEILSLYLDKPVDPVDYFAVVAFIFRRMNAYMVCRAWKSRVESMSRMWSVVWMYRYLPADFIAYCLRQTNARHFSLFIDPGPFHPVDAASPRMTLAAFGDMLSLTLPPHFPRVEHLRLKCMDWVDWDELGPIVFALDGTGIRRLQACIADLDCGAFLDTAVESWTGVQKLELSCIFPSGIHIFRHLTALCITRLWHFDLEITAVLDALRATCSLRMLELCYSEYFMDDADALPVTLLHLTHLQLIYASYEDSPIHLLTRLRLPALHTFRLQTLYGTLSPQLAAACPFSPRLRNVQVAIIASAASSLLPSWALLRDVVTLDISGSSREVWASLRPVLTNHIVRWAGFRNLRLAWACADHGADEILVLLESLGVLNTTIVFGPSSHPRKEYSEWSRVDGRIVSSRYFDMSYMWTEH
ncbi:hypothetical protein C8R46DRAFT_1029454 [Mycena filopes]|nr:hypothetical protein C8R46DRAFT_1029454 [Mycena filopes]